MVATAGVPENIQPYISAHFMGSCRMGKDLDSCALDPTGQTWEVEDLYVIDGSSLPSNIGRQLHWGVEDVMERMNPP